jgi:AcrR family transcriptional regulator
MNRKKTKTGPDTKQRILDASEILFAANGFRGTSLRAITCMAKVNLAAVNYHFGSKTSLLEEVIKRRILPLNKIRRKRLEEVQEDAVKKGKNPDIRAVLYAFIEPTLLFRESGPGAKNFITFIGRSFADPDDTVRKVFVRFITPMFQLLYKTVWKALPDLTQETLFWRLQFTLGSLFHMMHICGNINMEPFNIKTDLDANSLIDLIIPYVTAGMKA